MNNLVKIFFSMLFLVSFLNANEIQVFSSFVKKIEIDKNSSFTKIYYGSAQEFYANPSKYLNKATIKNANTYVMQSLTNGAKSLFAGGSGKGGLIGLASVAVVSLGKMGFDWFVSDNEYIYLSLVTNVKGEQTLLYTLIVSNDSLNEKEGISLALSNQKKIKGK